MKGPCKMYVTRLGRKGEGVRLKPYRVVKFPHKIRIYKRFFVHLLIFSRFIKALGNYPVGTDLKKDRIVHFHRQSLFLFGE